MRRFAFIALALAACGAESDIPDAYVPVCDPRGNWSLTLTPTGGNCGGGVQTDNFTITANPSGGYTVTLVNPPTNATVTITGRVTDRNGACLASITENYSAVSGGETGVYNLNLTESRRNVTGSAAVTFSGNINCFENYSVTGIKQ